MRCFYNSNAVKHSLRRTNQFLDKGHRVHVEFVVLVGVVVDVDGLVGDGVVACLDEHVAHTVEHVRQGDLLKSPEDHVLNLGESLERDLVVDAQRVGNHAQHFGMHAPVEHVMVDLVEHDPYQVEHVAKLGCDALNVEGAVEHGVVAEVVEKIVNRIGCVNTVPVGHRGVQPLGRNDELFEQERFHCLLITKICNIKFQFFILCNIKNG